jgi:hypothetical protein
VVPPDCNKPIELRPPNLRIISSIYEPKTYLDDTYVHQKYVVEMLNLSQIARLTFTSRNTIRIRLEGMGVTIRSQVDQEKMQHHKKYGFKKVQGEATDHKTEQRIIHTILKMRSRNVTYQDIADFLQEMKIPT